MQCTRLWNQHQLCRKKTFRTLLPSLVLAKFTTSTDPYRTKKTRKQIKRQSILQEFYPQFELPLNLKLATFQQLSFLYI